MANISLTTLHSDCFPAWSDTTPTKASATRPFESKDIPKTFPEFWNILNSPEIVAHVSDSSYGTLQCRLERKEADDEIVLMDEIQTGNVFYLTCEVDECRFFVKVNPFLVRQELDYYCKGIVSANIVGDRTTVQSWLRKIGGGLRLIHERMIRDLNFGLVTVLFCLEDEESDEDSETSTNRSQNSETKLTISTSNQELDYDSTNQCKILTLQTADYILFPIDVNYGVYINVSPNYQEFNDVKYYVDVEEVCKTVLSLFPSMCVRKFEPFIEHCETVAVISNLGFKGKHQITVVTSLSNNEVERWPTLDNQQLRLICELEDQVFDLGLMIEVNPNFYFDRVDYYCKATLLGGFLTRSILKEWTDIFEAAIQELHECSRSILKPYGNVKIVFYSDFTGLSALQLGTDSDSESETEPQKTVKVVPGDFESISSSHLLRRRFLVKKHDPGFQLKNKLQLKNGSFLILESVDHFGLVVVIPSLNDDRLELDLYPRKIMSFVGDNNLAWPRLKWSSTLPTELVLVLDGNEPKVIVIIAKRNMEDVSYRYGIAHFRPTEDATIDDETIAKVVEDVVFYFHDLNVSKLGFSVGDIEVYEPWDERFRCLSKLILEQNFWQTLVHGVQNFFKAFKERLGLK